MALAAVRLLALSVSLTMLVSCGSRSSSSFVWGAFSSEGNSLYVMRYTKRESSGGVPIPESGTAKLLEQRFEILELDLDSGRTKETGVVVVPSEFLSKPWEMDVVTPSKAGKPGLRSRSEVAEELRRAANISCDGRLDFDLQDSRVLYYACLDDSAFFRFEPPYLSATKIPLGTDHGFRSPQIGGVKLASVLGDKYVYMWGGKELLFQVDLGDPGRIVELDRFARPGTPMETSGESPRTASAENTGSSLVAVAPDLRIHEVRHGDQADAVILRPGKPNLVVRLPADFAVSANVTRRYIAKSNLVLWLMREPLQPQAVFAIDVASGGTMRATLPGD